MVSEDRPLFKTWILQYGEYEMLERGVVRGPSEHDVEDLHRRFCEAFRLEPKFANRNATPEFLDELSSKAVLEEFQLAGPDYTDHSFSALFVCWLCNNYGFIRLEEGVDVSYAHLGYD